MTDKEVIKGLQAVNEHIGKHFNEGGTWMAEFIDNAIKLLEQPPCEDAISREEALKVMCDKCPMYNCVTGCSSYRHIEKMPSVTPSYNSIKTELKPCEDCISRIEAIENFASWYGYDYDNQGYYRLLKQMPSVTPEQSFINKPCISEGVCREDKLQVLDKIKEEIRDNTYFINEITEKEGIDFETVEKIIDKYIEGSDSE